MTTPANLKQNRGFTLVELLVSLVILAVALLGMMKMQISSIQSVAFGGRMTAATALAQEQMEALLHQDLEATGGPFDPAINPWPVPDAQLRVDLETIIDPVIMGKTFKGYRISAALTANAPINQMATAEVWVAWPGSKNPIKVKAVRRRAHGTVS